MTRPRPVLTSAGIAGGITSLAGVLTFLGYVGPAADLTARAQAIGAVIVAAVGFGSHLLAGLHAQGKVTPLADPVAHDGTPLVKVPKVSPLELATATVSNFEPITLTSTYTPVHAEPDAIDADDTGMDDSEPATGVSVT